MQVGLLLVLLFIIAVAFGADGKSLALEINMNVLLAEAGHIGFNDVSVFLFLYVRAEALYRAAEEAALHFLHLTEWVVYLSRFAVGSEIRCKFKHSKNPPRNI